MIVYLDTSALVKRYFKESYSDEVISKWTGATEIISSSVAYAETLASFYRKKREARIKDNRFRRIVDLFGTEWKSFIRVEVSDELNRYIERAIEKYPLRGFDAIHLASAMITRERLREDYLFVCFDRSLNQSAQKEGLDTFPHHLS